MIIWKTKDKKPDINEVVLIAIRPNIICLGVWNGVCFTNSNFQKKVEFNEIDYWSSITNPFVKKGEKQCKISIS